MIALLGMGIRTPILDCTPTRSGIDKRQTGVQRSTCQAGAKGSVLALPLGSDGWFTRTSAAAGLWRQLKGGGLDSGSSSNLASFSALFRLARAEESAADQVLLENDTIGCPQTAYSQPFAARRGGGLSLSLIGQGPCLLPPALVLNEYNGLTMLQPKRTFFDASIDLPRPVEDALGGA